MKACSSRTFQILGLGCALGMALFYLANYPQSHPFAQRLQASWLGKKIDPPPEPSSGGSAAARNFPPPAARPDSLPTWLNRDSENTSRLDHAYLWPPRVLKKEERAESGFPNPPEYKPTQLLKGHTDQVMRIALSQDGLHAASTGLDRSLCLWSLPSGKLKIRHPLDRIGEPYNVSLSADGSLAALTVMNGERSACLVETASGRLRPFSQSRADSDEIAISPRGADVGWTDSGVGDVD